MERREEEEVIVRSRDFRAGFVLGVFVIWVVSGIFVVIWVCVCLLGGWFFILEGV